MKESLLIKIFLSIIDLGNLPPYRENFRETINDAAFISYTATELPYSHIPRYKRVHTRSFYRPDQIKPGIVESEEEVLHQLELASKTEKTIYKENRCPYCLYKKKYGYSPSVDVLVCSISL